MDFLASLSSLFSTILVFIPVLVVLVTVHELGHFLAARATGTRADTFAVGMGKRVMGFNKITGFSFGSLSEEDEQTVSESGLTDYRLSMLPIGGYVKIAGMVDESMDTEFTNREPQPWEFRSKNAAQKLLIMVAGVVMNILLAIGIYAGLAYGEGKVVLDTTTIGYVEPKGVCASVGLQAGDRILSINGTKLTSWNDLPTLLLTKNLGEDRTLLVQNSTLGETTARPIVITDKLITDALNAQKSIVGELTPAGATVLISAVETLKPAGKLGLLAGDTLTALGGVALASPMQMIEIVKASAGKELSIEWKRGKSQMSGKLTPTADGKIGVGIAPAFANSLRRQSYSITESVTQGWHDMVSVVQLQAAGLAQLFSGKTSIKQSVGGPIMIGKMSKQAADQGFTSLLRFTALFSVMLAIMNILPLPALDGGHVMFILIETVIRREIPVKIKMGVQQVGIVLLLCLMVFVFYNDITR
jgi:regulator of sigma E protease